MLFRTLRDIQTPCDIITWLCIQEKSFDPGLSPYKLPFPMILNGKTEAQYSSQEIERGGNEDRGVSKCDICGDDKPPNTIECRG